METTTLNNTVENNAVNTLESMAENFRHINGWGIDADPANEPTYPMKKYTGDDHLRSNYTRPPLQPLTVEILRSNERSNVPAVFGAVNPPTGLSGAIRRWAFRYSEESLRHWFALVLADRINVFEGIATDLKQGKVPNIIAEKGLKSEWKYNRKAVVKKAVIGAAVIAAAVYLLSKRKQRYA
jgi:hypothetical protein